MKTLTILCLIVSFGLAAAPQASQPLRVPEGFVIEQVAGAPEIRFPMFGAFDEQGGLFITESSGGDLYEELKQQKRGCRISRLEDRNGDGRFDTIRVFAEQLVPSMGLVWRDGKLYVADPPDLIVLEDRDGDGRAETRTVILSGFGHTDNGSLHGLTFGPDGWLYMTMGWPDGYRLKDRHGNAISGSTGALIRCRPDGSMPQALSRGFDQLIEVVFLPGGEVLGSQTWYHNPSGGLRDCLTHLVPGGLYPQRWQDERPRPFATSGEALPPLLMLPAVAHSGIQRYRGTLFPSEWRGQIFSAEFNTRKVVRFALTRQGATFTAESHDLVTTDDPDFRPADVLEDADGSLLVLDTGSWYVQHCPTGRMRQTAAPGAIYRVRRVDAQPLPDPRGRLLDWAQPSINALGRHLQDARPAVRDRALEALVQQGPKAIQTLTRTARSEALDDEIRTSGVWGLGRIGGSAALTELRALLRSTNDPVLSAASRALALHGDQNAAPELEKLLAHPQTPVRLAAAEALADCGRASSSPALFQALLDEPDRLLEHALIFALHRTAAQKDLQAALDHSAPPVQKAALVVLAQEPHRVLTPAQVLARAASTNEPLRTAAQFCLRLRPDWAQHAVEFIDGQLRVSDSNDSQEAALFALLRALQNEAATESILTRALSEPDDLVSVARKLALLDLLSHAKSISSARRDALARTLEHPSLDLRLRTVQLMAAAPTNEWDPTLTRLAIDPSEEAALRVEALSGLVRRQPELPPPGFALLAARLAPANSPLAKVRAAEVLALSRVPGSILRDLLAAAAEEPAISPNLVLSASVRTQVPAHLFPPLLQYLTGSIERGWAISQQQLDPLFKTIPPQATEQSEALRRAVQTQTEQQQALLREYEPLLRGGDAARGRQIYVGKASCATCHKLGQEGRDVGPDLTKLGAIRSGLDILESVLLPSATFAQGYDTYQAELADGESVTGVLSRETPDAIVLRNTSGAELRLPRNEVSSLTKSRLSMMPEGLLQILTREEAADLLAFLQDLK